MLRYSGVVGSWAGRGTGYWVGYVRSCAETGYWVSQKLDGDEVLGCGLGKGGILGGIYSRLGGDGV